MSNQPEESTSENIIDPENLFIYEDFKVRFDSTDVEVKKQLISDIVTCFLQQIDSDDQLTNVRNVRIFGDILNVTGIPKKPDKAPTSNDLKDYMSKTAEFKMDMRKYREVLSKVANEINVSILRNELSQNLSEGYAKIMRIPAIRLLFNVK